MKTSELRGAALDWAVAKALGYTTSDLDLLYDIKSYDKFHPSTDWSLMGPIIERERIKLIHEASEVYSHGAKWWATTDGDYEDPMWREFGSTPLIAAARCYVASKLGDEVPVPDELLEF